MKKTKTKRSVSRVTDKQIADALSKTNGIKCRAARIIGISAALISTRIRDSEELRAHCHQLVEDRIDRAEQTLDNLLADNNVTACLFTLKTVGRTRGYIEHAPEESVDQSKLALLKDFFSAIGSKPLATKSDEPKSPDSSLAKTSPLVKDIPMLQSDAIDFGATPYKPQTQTTQRNRSEFV